MKVSSVKEAWELANRLLHTDYEKDEEMSRHAGYPIYHSTADGVNAWAASLIAQGLMNEPVEDCFQTSHGNASCSVFSEMIPDIYKKHGKFYAALVYRTENGKPEYELNLC